MVMPLSLYTMNLSILLPSTPVRLCIEAAFGLVFAYLLVAATYAEIIGVWFGLGLLVALLLVGVALMDLESRWGAAIGDRAILMACALVVIGGPASLCGERVFTGTADVAIASNYETEIMLLDMERAHSAAMAAIRVAAALRNPAEQIDIESNASGLTINGTVRMAVTGPGVTASVSGSHIRQIASIAPSAMTAFERCLAIKGFELTRAEGQTGPMTIVALR